jgi:tetratricopeptide (TPR) repeat protein
MRIYILYLCFSIISVSALSQPASKNIALLQQKITISKEDTNKVLFYLRLADSFVAKNSYNNALVAAQKGLALSKKLNYVHGEILSFFKLGSAEEGVTKDYPQAIAYYTDAIKIAEKNGSYNDLNASYGCILNMYYYIGDYPGAMIIAQKGLVRAERTNDKANLAHYYNQFGFIYLQQEKPDEALKYYGQYLNLATQTGNPSTLADAYNCMADVYQFEKGYKASLQYRFNALNIYKRLDNLAKVSKSKYFIKGDRVAYTLFKISNTYKFKGDYKLSLQYALNGFNYRIAGYAKAYNPYDLASYYINTGEVYMNLKDYRNAMHFLNKGLSLSITIKHRQDILDAYSGLSKTFALQKRYDSA